MIENSYRYLNYVGVTYIGNYVMLDVYFSHMGNIFHIFLSDEQFGKLTLTGFPTKPGDTLCVIPKIKNGDTLVGIETPNGRKIDFIKVEGINAEWV
jgi:hypothetical protein